MTVAQILFGTFALGPWINENVEIANQFRDAALDNATLLQNIEMSQIWGTIQVLLLVLVFLVISVLKPWKGRRKKK